jgi:Type-1V conjugative transfer system mating pair stabilisation
MMICPYFLMIVWFFSLPVSASLQQGKDFGNKMLSQYGDLAIKIKPTEVLPHYTPNPKETGLNESTLDKNVVETMKTHPSAHLVKESEEKRGKHFKIHEDPLVLFSKEISQDPLALLSKFYKNCKEISVEGSPVKVETESRTCEESGDSYPLTCIKNLVVTVTKSPPTPVTFGFSLPKLWNSHRGFWNKYFKMGWGRHPQGSTFDFGGHNKGDDPGYARHFTYVPNPVLDRQFLSDLFAITDRIDVVAGYPYVKRGWGGISYADPRSRPRFTENVDKLKIKRVIALPGMGNVSYSGQHFWLRSFARIELDIVEPPVITESWTSTCDLLEEKVDSGLCIYTDKKCTQGSGTRLINGFSVTKPCWQETFTYQCSVPSKNDCDILRNKGCHQNHSKCQQFIGKTCVLYTQTFTCSKPFSQKGSGIRTKIVCGDAPPCLSGDCVEQGYPLNDEMLQAISQMSILKELQNQIKNGIPEIFKGNDNRCTRNIADFRDCCGSDGGWGTSLSLASTCSLQEKELKLKRKNKQCRRIGTFCSKKLIVCLEKTTTFCCFGSGFLRILQEQCRGQLGLGWGSAENPVCRGLTVEELSKVDFSKLDLSEIYHEISARYKQPQSSSMGKHLESRMKVIQESLKEDPKAKQRGEG